eukprot:TRINITY_DN2594_c0_g1_i2.p1 TRINITY_DN2594_c0_g1~~TRINITY_DN2594_c0_g1_i2.p1  ORF type:complete len:400 (+),score=113.91 TRINITY_DN2594_c0_g1_i2:784-1983(+)
MTPKNSDEGVKSNELIGDMKLMMQMRAASILPDKHYFDLFQLLVANSMSVTKKLASCSNQKEKVVADCLVKAFEMRNSAAHLIKVFVEDEINSTSDPNIIFRGNTVCTKSVDTFMRLTGMPYLMSTLKPIVAQIYTAGKSCELDPSRIEEQKEEKREKVAQKNLKNLLGYVDQIFQKICSSIDVVPMNFHNIFEKIRLCVEGKWPSHPTALYTAASAFIFLRFFCPSLLAPKLFGLADTHPPSNVARDLTLITKTIQNMANLVIFGKKEAFMVPCNEYIEKNKDTMKKFLDQLCRPKDRVLDEAPLKKDSLNWGREMANIHYHLKDSLQNIKLKYTSTDDVTELESVSKVLSTLDGVSTEEGVKTSQDVLISSTISSASSTTTTTTTSSDNINNNNNNV